MNSTNMQAPPLPARTARMAPRLLQRGMMEFMQEERDYNVVEFYEQFNDRLPKTVVVNEGFCGDIIEDIFDRGQVLRLSAISKQRRVIAKFQYLGASSLISIPDSYNEKLCIVRQRRCGKPKDIYTILKEETLPLVVQFPKDHTVTVGNQTVSTNNIPSLELIQTFDEVYLLGNFISAGTMNLEVVAVPLYLSQLRLSFVIGIKGQSKDKWREYQDELDRTASYIEYDQHFGNQNIAEYDPSAIHSDTTYTYVEPRLYSNIVKLVHKSPTRSFQNATYNPESHHHDGSNDDDGPAVYDEIDAVDKSTPSTKISTHVVQPTHKEKIESALKSLTTPTGEIKNIASPLASVKPEMTRYSSSPMFVPRPNAIDTTLGPALYEEIVTADKAIPATKKTPHVIQSTGKGKTEVALKPVGESKDVRSQLSSVKPQMTRNNAPPTSVPRPKARGMTQHTAIVPPPPTSTYPMVPERRPTSINTQPQNVHARDVTTALYTNDIPRKQISPTVQVAQGPNSVRSFNPREGENVVRELNNPEEVAKLTITELAVYLKKLNLEKYIKTFQQQLINGRMLVELDRDILKEEFGMTAIEALRLLNFAKDGHVPT